MGRTIIICLAVLTMPVVVFTTLAKAQQMGPIEAARAAAAGPEFCPRGPCPGFADIKVLKRSVSPNVPKPAGQPKTGPFPPQPYQSSQSRLQVAAHPRGEGDAYQPPPLKTNVGKTPSSLNLSGNDNVRAPQPDLGAYSPQLEARAFRMFPSGSQEQERQQWMADQEKRGIANEINRTKPLLYPVSGR
jgi:hypothetical protein